MSSDSLILKLLFHHLTKDDLFNFLKKTYPVSASLLSHLTSRDSLFHFLTTLKFDLSQLSSLFSDKVHQKQLEFLVQKYEVFMPSVSSVSLKTAFAKLYFVDLKHALYCSFPDLPYCDICFDQELIYCFKDVYQTLRHYLDTNLMITVLEYFFSCNDIYARMLNDYNQIEEKFFDQLYSLRFKDLILTLFCKFEERGRIKDAYFVQLFKSLIRKCSHTLPCAVITHQPGSFIDFLHQQRGDFYNRSTTSTITLGSLIFDPTLLMKVSLPRLQTWVFNIHNFNISLELLNTPLSKIPPNYHPKTIIPEDIHYVFNVLSFPRPVSIQYLRTDILDWKDVMNVIAINHPKRIFADFLIALIFRGYSPFFLNLEQQQPSSSSTLPFFGFSQDEIKDYLTLHPTSKNHIGSVHPKFDLDKNHFCQKCLLLPLSSVSMETFDDKFIHEPQMTNVVLDLLYPSIEKYRGYGMSFRILVNETIVRQLHRTVLDLLYVIVRYFSDAYPIYMMNKLTDCVCSPAIFNPPAIGQKNQLLPSSSKPPRGPATCFGFSQKGIKNFLTLHPLIKKHRSSVPCVPNRNKDRYCRECLLRPLRSVPTDLFDDKPIQNQQMKNVVLDITYPVMPIFPFQATSFRQLVTETIACQPQRTVLDLLYLIVLNFWKAPPTDMINKLTDCVCSPPILSQPAFNAPSCSTSSFVRVPTAESSTYNPKGDGWCKDCLMRPLSAIPIDLFSDQPSTTKAMRNTWYDILHPHATPFTLLGVSPRKLVSKVIELFPNRTVQDLISLSVVHEWNMEDWISLNTSSGCFCEIDLLSMTTLDEAQKKFWFVNKEFLPWHYHKHRRAPCSQCYNQRLADLPFDFPLTPFIYHSILSYFPGNEQSYYEFFYSQTKFQFSDLVAELPSHLKLVDIVILLMLYTALEDLAKIPPCFCPSSSSQNPADLSSPIDEIQWEQVPLPQPYSRDLMIAVAEKLLERKLTDMDLKICHTFEHFVLLISGYNPNITGSQLLEELSRCVQFTPTKPSEPSLLDQTQAELDDILKMLDPYGDIKGLNPFTLHLFAPEQVNDTAIPLFVKRAVIDRLTQLQNRVSRQQLPKFTNLQELFNALSIPADIRSLFVDEWGMTFENKQVMLSRDLDPLDLPPIIKLALFFECHSL